MTNTQSSAEVCSRQHPIRGIGIYCSEPGCNRLIVLSTKVYQDRKAATFAYVTMIVLSTMAVLLLSRFATQVWPLYLFLALGVVLLYAAVFSRGATIGPATWILTTSAMVWLIWQISSNVFGLSLGDSRVAGLVIRTVPPLVWLLFTVYMGYLGLRNNLAMVREPGTYFLAVATFTLGFWGVWLILLENNLVNTLLYQLAIGFGLLLPLLCVGLLIWQAPAGTIQAEQQTRTDTEATTTNGRWHLLALWLVVVATYLVLIEPMIQALAFVLGRFLPLAVGREPLTDITVGWLGGPGWRALLTSVLLMIATTLVAVRSFMEITTEVGAPQQLSATDSSEDLGRLAAEMDAAAQGGAHDPVSELAKDIGETVVYSYREAGYAGNYYGRIGLRFAENVLSTARYLLNVAVPVVVFSLLSVAVVLVLEIFQDYRGHGPFFDSFSLWGTGLSTGIVVVLLCGLAFEAAPHQKDSLPNDSRSMPRRRRLVATGAASLLGGLLYFLASLVSAALLPLWLYPLDSSATSDRFVPGEIFLTNLALSMTAFVTLALLVLAFRRWRRKSQESIPRSASTASATVQRPPTQARARAALIIRRRGIKYGLAAVVLLVLGAAAVYFAWLPVKTSTLYLSAPYDASSEAELRSQVPASLTALCTRDKLMLTGYKAGLACRPADGTLVSYHLFATESQMSQWYSAAIANRGITNGQGTCGQTVTAEGEYARGTGKGRIACYRERGGSWLLWTDITTRTLGIAHTTDSTPAGLYDKWTTRMISV